MFCLLAVSQPLNIDLLLHRLSAVRHLPTVLPTQLRSKQVSKALQILLSSLLRACIFNKSGVNDAMHDALPDVMH